MGDATEGTGGASDPRDVANYVAALSRDLAALAKGARLPVLAYFLEMATAEAESSASRTADQSGDRNRH